MKRIILLSMILGMIIGMRVSVCAKEKSATELYKENRDAFYKKYMCIDEEAEENGYYTEAKKETKTSKSKKETNISNGIKNHGYVYGVDELHIAGLPTDERGYTKAGDYGEIK